MYRLVQNLQDATLATTKLSKIASGPGFSIRLASQSEKVEPCCHLDRPLRQIFREALIAMRKLCLPKMLATPPAIFPAEWQTANHIDHFLLRQ
jgi:hypothetical protein